MKFASYIILYDTNPDGLASKVSRLMSQGYIPIGGVAVRNYRSWEFSNHTSDHDSELFQAVGKPAGE